MNIAAPISRAARLAIAQLLDRTENAGLHAGVYGALSTVPVGAAGLLTGMDFGHPEEVGNTAAGAAAYGGALGLAIGALRRPTGGRVAAALARNALERLAESEFHPPWRTNPTLQQNLVNRIANERARDTKPKFLPTPEGSINLRPSIDEMIADPNNTLNRFEHIAHNHVAGNFLLGGAPDPDAMRRLADYNRVPRELVTPQRHEAFLQRLQEMGAEKQHHPLNVEYWRDFLEVARTHLPERTYLWLRRNPTRTQAMMMTLDGKSPTEIHARLGYKPKSMNNIRQQGREFGVLMSQRIPMTRDQAQSMAFKRWRNRAEALAPYLATGGGLTAVWNAAMQGGAGRGAILDELDQDQ